MDSAKLRFAAAAGAILFGVAGLAALSIALVLLLSTVLGSLAATATVGAMYAALAFACLYVFLMPHKPASDEIDDLESATAAALADLPFEAVKSIVQKRPLASMTLALAAGYSMMKDPDGAMKGAQRIVLGLI